MITQRSLFLHHLAQTSGFPMLLEIEKAEGIYLYDKSGKKYIDLISGVSVSNTGHRHPEVVKAVKKQVDQYIHVMVYGEYIQSPQVKFAKLLTDNLPESLNSVYLVNSGSEAVEGALKLAKRYTGRFEIISFRNAYHGSTHGALSVTGNETMKNSFRPLLPDVWFLNFNNSNDLKNISNQTACVIIEPIQGEAGIIVPDKNYLRQLRRRCTETGTLLIFDEIQTGFGRTGSLFAFEQEGAIPDILLIAKGIGGGMPLGAFIADKTIMDSFKTDPALGHITTFGGHPVSCAAAHANLSVILKEKLISGIKHKEQLFRKNLTHAAIREIRGTGLFLAVQLDNFEQVKKVIAAALKNGVILDWFLFCNSAFRIAPPLIINEKEIVEACRVINEAIDFSVSGLHQVKYT
ncbi:MAG: aspartate aminotransferase family protein [Bacteroidia bacterium]|nr:aspartate aminotransferase family protein [Bacteroidia bacterium]